MHRTLVFAAALALSACAGLQAPSPQQDVEFEVAGRIAVRYRDEAASGNVAWRHARDGDELLITSPVGSSVARLVRDGTGYVLTTAEPREFRADDAEALTGQVLGFRLPLAGLSDWIRARPVAGRPADLVRDAQGRPEVLVQDGWRIEYQELRADGLPVRLKLTYPGLELRLAIHDWKTGP